MLLHLHQTHNQIADFKGIYQTIVNLLNQKEDCPSLHAFPELFLCGYPLRDLCLQKDFKDAYLDLLQSINLLSNKLTINTKKQLLLGGISYEGNDIYNVIYQLIPGQSLQVIYKKQKLPNYNIFDEKKYYKSGDKNTVINFNGIKIALLICEDMWTHPTHQYDPIESLQKSNESIDLVINISASPFDIHKKSNRIAQANKIATTLNAKFAYVNRVGGEDGILFDGASFILDQNKQLIKASDFTADCITYNLSEKPNQTSLNTDDIKYQNEDLDLTKVPAKLFDLDDNKCLSLEKAICFGLKEYAQKSGFDRYLIALSGGIDSALVALLCYLILDDKSKLECIYMPSPYSSELSEALAKEMCDNMKVKLHTIKIDSLYNETKRLIHEETQQTVEGLCDENIQSRIRSMLLLARSNQTNSLVINTSNKSELAVGYSTIYGDSVGAISPLGDLFKTEVYRLAQYLNQKYNYLIPNKIITRAPSAELRLEQKDSDSLPPYDRLDAILECLLSYNFTSLDIIKLGFTEEEVKKTYQLFLRSEYKRKQFCPIIKLKTKTFDYGYQVPINKQTNFYFN